MESQQPRISLILLAMLISFASVSGMFITPALPEISDYFQIPEQKSQLLMSLFLLGYGVGQLPYGTMSNQYGRLKTLKIGLSITLVSIFICLLGCYCHIYTLLLIGRCIMALGAAVGLVLTFTLIKDNYPLQQSRVVTAKVMLAFAVLPALVTMLCGFIVDYINWQSCFVAMFIYTLITLIWVCKIPMALDKKQPSPVNLSSLFKSYIAQCRVPYLIPGSILMGSVTSVVYLFAAISPFLIIDNLQMEPADFGLLNLFLPVGTLIGTYIANKLAQRISMYAMATAGIIIMGLSVVAMFFCFIKLTALSVFIPMTFIYLGLAMTFANISAISTSQSDNAAVASSLMSFINIMLTFLWVLSLNYIPRENIFLMPILFAVLLVLCLGLLAWPLRQR